MGQSDPMLVSADIPREAQPGNTFTIPFEARQAQGGGPLGSFAKGGCVTKTLDINGWTTPVTLWVDGERRDTNKMCLAPDNSRSGTFSVSLSEGEHRVAVKVHPVGDIHPIGQSWENNLDMVGDEMQATVSVSRDASDPSERTEQGSLMQALNDIAAKLGTTVNVVAIGAVAVLGAVLLL